MRELLSNDEFMTWVLGLSVYLMFFALGWKTTDPERTRYRRPSPHWSRQLVWLLHPLGWFVLVVAGPSVVSVVAVRRLQDAWQSRSNRL